jgi:hypothetical protein
LDPQPGPEVNYQYEMIYKTDYHIHSWFSDGKGAPEDYIAPAVAAGIKEIGFSEHLTLFRGFLEWSMDSPDVERYIRHIKVLKENTGYHCKNRPGSRFLPGKKEIRSVSAMQILITLSDLSITLEIAR